MFNVVSNRVSHHLSPIAITHRGSLSTKVSDGRQHGLLDEI